jgi:hypothetical protein
MGKIGKESQDVTRATENVDALKTQLAELETHMEADVAEMSAEWDLANAPFERVLVKPSRGGVSVQLVGIAWIAEPVLSERRGAVSDVRRESNGR